MSALDRLKIVKREKVRFQLLAQSLITEPDVDYKVCNLIFQITTCV